MPKGRGKPWTDIENTLVLEMVSEGLTPREIYESGKFPDRSQDSIRAQIQRLWGPSFVQTKYTAIVQTIKPSEALTLDEVVKLFSTAFREICAVKEVDKLSLERFRIIFQAAKDYAPLLKFYEDWEAVKTDVERLKGLVASYWLKRRLKGETEKLDAQVRQLLRQRQLDSKGKPER